MHLYGADKTVLSQYRIEEDMKVLCEYGAEAVTAKLLQLDKQGVILPL